MSIVDMLTELKDEGYVSFLKECKDIWDNNDVLIFARGLFSKSFCKRRSEEDFEAFANVFNRASKFRDDEMTLLLYAGVFSIFVRTMIFYERCYFDVIRPCIKKHNGDVRMVVDDLLGRYSDFVSSFIFDDVPQGDKINVRIDDKGISFNGKIVVNHLHILESMGDLEHKVMLKLFLKTCEIYVNNLDTEYRKIVDSIIGELKVRGGKSGLLPAPLSEMLKVKGVGAS